MNHDDIRATIKELDEKVKSIIFEMTKNAGNPSSIEMPSSVTLEALPDNRELKLELADVYNDLGHAYQQIGNERDAQDCFRKFQFYHGRGEG